MTSMIIIWICGKQGLISAVDVVYTSIKTGEMVCCEVVTNSYKDSDIQGKEYCGEILQMEVEYVRVLKSI